MNVLPRQKEKIMMKKKILVLALAAAMTFETIAPAIAFADELPAEDTAIAMWWGDHVVTTSVDSPGQPALGMARGRTGI